jgi:hypothetical protein
MNIAKRLDPYLEPLMGAVRVAERWLGPDDDWVEDDRRIAYEWAQRHFGHLHTFAREKGPADYFTTAHARPDVVERVLHDGGYQRNLASSRKYRTHHDGGKQWAVGSWVLDPTDTDWQHHVYLFPAPNGGTDVYGHRETSVREGAEHLTEPQTHGDPNGRVRGLLSDAGIEHGKRNL